ncbi:MAG: arsenate reductase ArsC [Pseudomonadota bacterium]
MTDRPMEVPFLCTGNAARSVMAECSLNRWGRGRFRAHSAGSHPRGAVHPLTLETLRGFGHDTSGLRSKSWDEFAEPDAPALDFVFTVCDRAAAEVCPVWPGQPMTTHLSSLSKLSLQRRLDDIGRHLDPEVKTRASEVGSG